MNFPSHASSSVGQVANAYMGNPQMLQQRTQPQNGVTPELIDLLALQKITAEKDAAARQMAMQSGQQPPTVAKGLEDKAMTSARQEIAQKLGLPGLMNQGQNVPQQGPPGMPAQGQPPGMPPPQAPVQAAAGGLMRLPSNLPQSYAGGGIIAFEGGGLTLRDPEFETDAQGNKTPRSKDELEAITRENAAIEQMKANTSSMPNTADKLQFAHEEANRRREAESSGLAQRMAQYYRPRAPIAVAPAAAAGQKTQFDPKAQGSMETLVAGVAQLQEPDRTAALNQLMQQFGAGAVIAALSKPPTNTAAAAPNAPPVVPQAQPNILGPMPTESPDDLARSSMLWDRVSSGVRADPERARKDEAARRLAELGPGQEAQRAAMQKGLAATEAGQQAVKDARQEGKTIFGLNAAALEAIAEGSPHAGAYWGSGVSKKVRERTAGYRAEDMAFQEKLNGLQQAMANAKVSNDIGAYKAAQDTLGKAISEREAYTKSGVQMADTATRALGTKQAAWSTAQARIQEQQLAAQTRQDAKETQFEIHRRDTAMRYAAQAAKDKLSKDLMYGTPNYKGPSEQELALEYFPSFLASLKNETPSIGNDPKTKALEALKKRGAT